MFYIYFLCSSIDLFKEHSASSCHYMTYTSQRYTSSPCMWLVLKKSLLSDFHYFVLQSVKKSLSKKTHPLSSVSLRIGNHILQGVCFSSFNEETGLRITLVVHFFLYVVRFLLKINRVLSPSLIGHVKIFITYMNYDWKRGLLEWCLSDWFCNFKISC